MLNSIFGFGYHLTIDSSCKMNLVWLMAELNHLSIPSSKASFPELLSQVSVYYSQTWSFIWNKCAKCLPCLLKLRFPKCQSLLVSLSSHKSSSPKKHCPQKQSIMCTCSVLLHLRLSLCHWQLLYSRHCCHVSPSCLDLQDWQPTSSNLFSRSTDLSTNGVIAHILWALTSETAPSHSL